MKFSFLFNLNIETFNPMGWVQDEAGGLWSGLRIVFGENPTRERSCKFHFGQCCCRQYSFFPPDLLPKFEVLIVKWKDTPDPVEFEYVHLNHIIFVNIIRKLYFELRTLCKVVNPEWLEWWYTRRTHWAECYRHSNAPTTTNTAESRHGVWN